MRAEARRIQERVKYEREIRLATLRRGPSGFDSDSDCAEELENDPDEWWQDLQDGKVPAEGAGATEKPKVEIRNPAEANRALHAFRPIPESVDELKRLLCLRADPNSVPTLPDGPSPMHKVAIYALEENVAEMRNLLLLYGAVETDGDKERLAARRGINDATRKLQVFRPIRETPEELERLLALRADPNGILPMPPGSISPLQNVMTFALEEHVVAMRDLLLQSGAAETKDDKERWVLRQDTDLHEHHRLRVFYEDDRHLSPCGASGMVF